jgi:uncharacterized protein (DUF433 family)
VVEAYLHRVERDERGIVARLYPFSRPTLDAPRIVVIDPWRGFGRPILRESGIATVSVAERFQAGESVEDLAADYGCSNAEISEALRFELLETA